MFDLSFAKNIKYYASFQLLYVILYLILSSIGFFFHFLLNHEISIVESWLHNNHWEILITGKLASLFLLNRWFKVKLYQLKPIRQLIRELVRWPERKAMVVSLFMTASYLSLAGVSFASQNFGYWYHHVASFFGLFLYFAVDFVVIAYLEDVLTADEPSEFFRPALCYTLLFTLAFRLTIPDYYQLLPYVLFCFSTLIYLSGRAFKNWSNVVCLLVVFVAPMGAFFGLDPVWGDDFSPFGVKTKLKVTFLVVIWVLSFCYYRYRDQIIFGARKLVR